MNSDPENYDGSDEFSSNETVEDEEGESDGNSDSSNKDPSVPIENTFDLTLPGTHSYLGENLQELSGRNILDDGIYMNLPLLIKQSVVLFPGQTLPLTVYGAQTINMLQTCIQNNRTFGVIILDYNKITPIGTTAEIYEYANEDSDQGFRIKAKGRQRFKILRVTMQGQDKISADVKVLAEITLSPPLYNWRLTTLDKLRMRATNAVDVKRQERIESLDATVTPWPAWVYRQYDVKKLSSKIRNHLRFMEKKGINIPEDPIELSFWVAQNFVLDDNERMDLLNYDCAITRLQKEIKYLIEDKIFVCCNCHSFIAKQSNMFPMSREGPQNAYCNAGGFVHETVTLYHAQGLTLNETSPSTAYSWFPGYAWTIASCENCGTHMGWKFTAVKNDLRPKTFWGLTRKNLKNRSA